MCTHTHTLATQTQTYTSKNNRAENYVSFKEIRDNGFTLVANHLCLILDSFDYVYQSIIQIELLIDIDRSA